MINLPKMAQLAVAAWAGACKLGPLHRAASWAPSASESPERSFVLWILNFLGFMTRIPQGFPPTSLTILPNSALLLPPFRYWRAPGSVQSRLPASLPGASSLTSVMSPLWGFSTDGHLPGTISKSDEHLKLIKTQSKLTLPSPVFLLLHS